ncbi:unnamed protein product [Brugia pahangi]|uniref:Aldo_ket_red domain-containing protein n=1 Tax=Brugia pahangi TaxID=6280 RepID=A0A0N4TY01_BRUPA|nr:unnamed protein product [Brugia pahangi]
MSTSHGYLLSIAMKEAKQSQNNDETSSNYNFDRYQKSKCSGMSYRQLGKISINVSTIAFGCGAMGGLFGDFKDSLDKLLNKALRSGVNYIDTAYWYGQADPKNFLDKFELDFSRPYDYRAHILLKQLTISLKRLKLCGYLLSAAETIFGESLEALRIAKLTGKAKYIGLALYTLRNIVYKLLVQFNLEVLSYVIENTDLKMDVVVTYGRANLCDNSLGEYIQRLKLSGVGIVNGALLSMGLLTNNGPPDWQPAPSYVFQAVSYCKSKGISLVKLAIGYAIQFPGISTCLIGVSNMDYFLQYLKVVCCDGLTDDEE